jgi:hypothetical protein
MTRRRVARSGVLGLCERVACKPGRARYGEGRVLLELDSGERDLVEPPFALAHEAAYPTVETAPLREHLLRPRAVGLLVVRLGGYAAAIYRDEELLDGRAGTRFVKNRNRKGGSSSGRFARRRSEQARELHDRAAELAAELLLPRLGELDVLVLAGDRLALAAVGERSGELAAAFARAERAAFSPPDPRSSALPALGRELWSSWLEQEQADGA